MIIFYWNIATSIHLHIICGYFCAAEAELCSCDKDIMVVRDKRQRTLLPQKQ